MIDIQGGEYLFEQFHEVINWGYNNYIGAILKVQFSIFCFEIRESRLWNISPLVMADIQKLVFNVFGRK